MEKETHKIPKTADVLTCSLADPPGSEPVQPKTVGDVMEMRCEGLMHETVTGGEIFFVKDEDKYALHLLEIVKADTGELVARVTSYKPGTYQQPEVYLRTPADRTYQLKGLAWNYDSVLEEAQKLQSETMEPPPEQLGPFPFFGPIGLVYPAWLWIVLALGVALPTFAVFRKIRKHSQKKQLISQALSGLGSALTPLQDFSKVQRQLIRHLDSPQGELTKYVEILDQGFRGYLVRRCQVPAFDWSESEVVKDIRKHYPVAFHAAGVEVLRVLREFRRIKNQACKREDLEQLLDQSRRAVEKIEANL